MALTDTTCRNAKPTEKPRKLSDGGGLFLSVQPNGSKLWRCAYRYDGRQKLLSFGKYPYVTLQEARKRRDEAKTQLAHGIDPSQARKDARTKTARENANTFEHVFREWFDLKRDGWTAGYADRMKRRMEVDIVPVIGKRPIHAIEPPELLHAIRTVEGRGAVVLASRLLQVSGQVFRYAIASGRAVRDPSQDLRGALRSAGPKKHHSALKPIELGPFLRTLDSYQGERQTSLALLLVLHTMVRTGEARFAVWSEFQGLDGENPLWRIPADRMKMRSEHIVPLTSQAVAILAELKEMSGRSEHVLPAPTKAGVISGNRMIYAMYRLGYHGRATVHGFRGTASTVLNEHGFNRDWIERQLAHGDRDGVRAAYNSAEWLNDRRAMMAWWSDYIDRARVTA